ncbi:type I restriction enzyme HsdR N-terminal domain-containing protein [Pontiella sp. NLcol2]|uniref:Type I restriction enzyme HsdR N-terminal domain-containing protein n=1 Tax=Pontiella agarivorans TaxID=3038953 RepID=A0ABU5N1I2_9BACT|nr:type I restriction enzyme HsdR N-terminal domain-containing protein [Pontiella agarivorans]MDZ8120263.1 type I restriction enzyme HsdR N-terminal domain-containing protein [Pontiella agarivorans]
MEKEAKARIKINRLLEEAGRHFFDDESGPANIVLEPHVKITQPQISGLGENFEQTKNGFIDFLLLDEKGFPFVVLEAKVEAINPLSAKEQARSYADAQNCRFVILSNGNLHYFWDLEQGNPYVISKFPTPGSVSEHRRYEPKPELFKNSLVGFSKADERGLLDASSPFAFWTINESRIFRFLKLIGCDNNDVGQYAKLVKERNDIAHSNGNIFYNASQSADQKMGEALQCIDHIQIHMQPVIHDCLKRFLLDSWDIEERMYADPSDQIREELVHAHYFSQKDIEACVAFDIEPLKWTRAFRRNRSLVRSVQGCVCDRRGWCRCVG